MRIGYLEVAAHIKYTCMIADVHSRTVIIIIAQSHSLLQESELSSTHQREHAATPETAPPPAKRRCLTPHKSDLEDVQTIGQSGSRETTIGQSGPTTRPFQTTLSHFSDDLRARYAKYPLPHHSNPQCRKWMPHVSKKYIDTHFITKEEQEEQPDSHKEAVLRGQRWRITTKGSGTPVQLKELLETRSADNRNVILVEGGPGMGKSTLAWQVCYQWGRGELFDQYSTVLLLPLRDERVQQAKHVEDFFFYLENEIAQREVMQELGTGKETLVILDGLDELPSHLFSKQSIFTDLLSGEVLGDATVLVTSRPSATQPLLTCWKQRMLKHVIIQGFNEEDIEEYAKSILSGEKLTEFQKQLSIHPHIRSIMYVPLHSAIVMAVYLQHKQLPKTRTQLYMALVETILSQYLDDHLKYCGEEKVSCAIGLELPKPVHAQLIQLCKIAFDTVCRQELIFTNKTMPKVLHDLGFTDSVPGLYMHGMCSYNFLHLSIQEFLAAYHVSLLSPQEQEELLPRSREEHYIKNMMRFVAGITKFKRIGKEAMKQVVVVKTKETRCYLDIYGCELLYESQNMSILGKEETYYYKSFNLLPVHWLHLGYCIANSKCAWNLDYIHLVDVNAPMLLQGLQDCKTQPAYTIKSIKWVLYSREVYRKLLDFITHTESMIIVPIRCGVQPQLIDFCQWLPTCHLNTLALPDLKPHQIEMVSGTLNAVHSLKILDIKGSKFTLQSMQAFAYMLEQNQSLIKVNISNCNIDSDGTCYLARALLSNTTLTLTVLEMRMNSAGSKGAVAIAEILKDNTTLKVLDMCRNAVGRMGALAMAEMLKHNTTLTVLDMSWNYVCDRGALAMAEMLKRNTTLEELYINADRTIGAEGAKALVESLAVNHHLKKLHMNGLYVYHFLRNYLEEVRALPAYHANKERVGTHMENPFEP